MIVKFKIGYDGQILNIPQAGFGAGLQSSSMRHFIQYHNPDLMGRYRHSQKDFAIVTNKFFTELVGGTVWLVTSKGQRPRRYYLCSSFVVDKVERDNAGRFRNRAVGSRGRDFDIEIGNEVWFPELLKTTGNFGLGLLPISSRAIVEGFRKVAAP
jgi:hypothetical protein